MFFSPPVKGSPENLRREDNAFNERIGKTRIFVENFFFGRMKNRHAIIGAVYRNSLDLYNKIFTLCCALTNFEIRLCGHGLRKEDGDLYSKFYTNEIEAMKHRAQEEQEKRHLCDSSFSTSSKSIGHAGMPLLVTNQRIARLQSSV